VASSDKNKDRLKFVGIGAGAGLLIGAITKQNALTSLLLGAGGGYLANEFGKKKPGDVALKSGSEFGVRVDRQFAFYTDRPEVRPASDERYYCDQPDRDRNNGGEPARIGIGVMSDDRNVTFGPEAP